MYVTAWSPTTYAVSVVVSPDTGLNLPCEFAQWTQCFRLNRFTCQMFSAGCVHARPLINPEMWIPLQRWFYLKSAKRCFVSLNLGSSKGVAIELFQIWWCTMESKMTLGLSKGLKLQMNSLMIHHEWQDYVRYHKKINWPSRKCWIGICCKGLKLLKRLHMLREFQRLCWCVKLKGETNWPSITGRSMHEFMLFGLYRWWAAWIA